MPAAADQDSGGDCAAEAGIPGGAGREQNEDTEKDAAGVLRDGVKDGRKAGEEGCHADVQRQLSEKRMKIGRIEFGRRINKTDKFYFFYVPILRTWYHDEFWFFWWIGKNWYVCFQKKKRKHR